MTLSKKDRGCHLVVAYAPPKTPMREANDGINEYVANHARGLLLFHDHFADEPGGVAVFSVETEEELAAVRDPGPLAGWNFKAHPLIFAGGTLEFLFQMDYTMQAYRGGRRLRTLTDAYAESELCAKNDGRDL